MRYIIGVANITWVAVWADNLDTALAEAGQGDGENLDAGDFTPLETDEFKVRLPNGDEVTSEEAIDLESMGEVVGE
jgi:hypothetical protein